MELCYYFWRPFSIIQLAVVLTVDLISWFPKNKHLISLMKWHFGLLNQMNLKLVIRPAEEKQLQMSRVPFGAVARQDGGESCLHDVAGSGLDQKPFLAHRFSVFSLLLL